MEKAYDRTYVLGDPPDYEPGPERSLAGLAAARGMTPLEVAYDEMAADGGEGLLYLPILNYATGDLDHVYDMLQHPRGLLGLSDGGAHTGTICDASMPTFMLTHWTRDRSRGATLPLEYVVKKQTHDTARLYGLSRPGHGRGGRPGRLQRHRLRRPGARDALRAPRPAGRGAPPAPTRRRGTCAPLRRGRSPSRTGSRPASCRAGCCAGRGSILPAHPLDRIRMDAPPTRYAVRDGVHIGYQVWGDGPVDVLEFNHGLMISIDETVDEPNWLGYTERVAAFSRLIRFDAGGLGLSDPLPAGRPPSIEVWADDALAVLDAAGCERAVVLCNTGGSMAALWLAAYHPERVAALIIVNGTARVGRAEDYEFGVPDELTVDAAQNIEMPLDDDAVPMDIAIFAPSLAHRVGFAAVVGASGPAGRQPGHGRRLQPGHLHLGRARPAAAGAVPDAGHVAHRRLHRPGRARPLPGRAHRRRALHDVPRARPVGLGG